VHSEGEWYLDMPCPTVYNLILAPKPLDSFFKKWYNILLLQEDVEVWYLAILIH